MLRKRPASERGVARLDWLDSRHSFSFGHYYDPDHMGHGPLRVLNEDRVQPGRGFATHAHRDMEILTLVLDGALEHRDSLGNGSVIRPGDMQRMSAGTGVEHSEFNASTTEPVHFLQIWVVPEANGLLPGYEQRGFADVDRQGRWCLVASRVGREQSVQVNRDLDLYVARLRAGDTLPYRFQQGRLGWVQLARGDIEVNGEPLEAGDGLAIAGPLELEFSHANDAEILLFDMV